MKRLSGLEKASVLMMEIGASASAKVFERLTQEERELLGAQIVKLEKVDDAVRKDVLNEVTNRIRYDKGLPPVGVDPTLPLGWVESTPAEEVYEVIWDERPQNVAMILGHLSPDYAAKLLSYYEDEKRNDIAFRLAKLQDVDPQLMEAVSMALRKRLEVHKVVKGSSKSVIANTSMNEIIEEAKSNVADSLESSYSKPEIEIEVGNRPDIELRQSFDLGEYNDEDSIEAIALFTPTEISELINNVEMSDICLALRLASDAAKNTFLDNVPQESKFSILSEIESPSHATISDIEDAQCRVMEVVKEIIDERSSMNAA